MLCFQTSLSARISNCSQSAEVLDCNLISNWWGLRASDTAMLWSFGSGNYRTVTCSMWTMFQAKNTVPGSASPRAIYSVHWQTNQCCILRYQLNCAFWSNWSRVLSLVTRWWVRLQGGLLRRELSCLMVILTPLQWCFCTRQVRTWWRQRRTMGLRAWTFEPCTSHPQLVFQWSDAWFVCLAQEFQRIPMLASPQLL